MNLNSYLITENKENPNKLTATGKILIGITGGVALGLTVICAPFVSPAFRKFCLPYIPATDDQIKNILRALPTSTRGNLIDLGSGDGRIVLEGAKRNLQSHGVELNPWLVLYSKLEALRKGHTNAKFFCKDLWKYNISNYDNVVIFGVEQMMADLETKILKECKTDCRIIACRFPLPNLEVVKIIGHGIDTVWIYKMPQKPL